jgi:predicted MFS family arabinose efflux permease
MGPRPIFAVSIGFYVVGLIMAATAPTMLVLVFARFVQGIGGGGLYVVSLSTVAKTYPSDIRPRVMALLASVWILPGLLGPPIGAIVAETVGWRYAFLASAAYFGIEGFVTLMLTQVRGLSVGAAGIVLMAAALTWAAGSWWQSRMVGRLGPRWLTSLGALMIAVGGSVVALGLLDLPIVIPDVGWAVGSFGMGIVFPTIPLSVMGVVAEGTEAAELSSTILMDYLGVGIAAGLGGAWIALADSGRISLEAGLAGAFGVGVGFALLLVFVGQRLPVPAPGPVPAQVRR